jgi:hypothetical protein
MSIGERREDLAQRSVEILIGRLITDEAFRSAYRSDPSWTIRQFIDCGYELTTIEITALASTQFDFWSRAAAQLDLRLQKADLSSQKR